MLKSNGSEQSLTVKQYLHKLMNGEFIERGCNRRFCAVVFQVTKGRTIFSFFMLFGRQKTNSIKVLSFHTHVFYTSVLETEELNSIEEIE